MVGGLGSATSGPRASILPWSSTRSTPTRFSSRARSESSGAMTSTGERATTGSRGNGRRSSTPPSARSSSSSSATARASRTRRPLPPYGRELVRTHLQAPEKRAHLPDSPAKRSDDDAPLPGDRAGANAPILREMQAGPARQGIVRHEATRIATAKRRLAASAPRFTLFYSRMLEKPRSALYNDKG